MPPVRFVQILLMGALFFAGFPGSRSQAEESVQGEEALPSFLSGQALVRFRMETPLSKLREISEALNVRLERELNPLGLYLITFHQSRPVEKVLEELRPFPEVLYAEPDYQILSFSEWVDSTRSGIVARQAARSFGFPIAVIDDGFDLDAPRLAGYLFKNSQEIPGDGMDNDGNGYPDDFMGYDFYRRDGNPQGEGLFQSHGTKVVRAVLHRSEDADLLLLPLRAGPGPWLATSAVCEAITYAIARGAQVINLSFGGWWASQGLIETVAYATQKRVILVASAGGEAVRWSRHLTRFPQILWVAAEEKKRWKARFFFTKPWQVSRLIPPDLSDATDQGILRKNSLTNHNAVSSVEGRVGKAAQFERDKGQYLTAPDSPDLSMGDADFTVTAWVYLDSKPAQNSEMVIVHKGNEQSNTQSEYLLRYENSAGYQGFSFVVTNGRDDWRRVDASSAGDPAVGQWIFLAAWHDSVNDEIAIQVNNGPVKKMDSYPSGSHDGAFPLRIGSYANVPSETWDGRIDEGGIWKRLLTPEERTDLYNRGLGNSYRPGRRPFSVDRQGTLAEGLVAYYPLDEGKPLWRLGQVMIAPFSFIGFFGLSLFLYSSVRGIALLARKR